MWVAMNRWIWWWRGPTVTKASSSWTRSWWRRRWGGDKFRIATIIYYLCNKQRAYYCVELLVVLLTYGWNMVLSDGGEYWESGGHERSYRQRVGVVTRAKNWSLQSIQELLAYICRWSWSQSVQGKDPSISRRYVVAFGIQCRWQTVPSTNSNILCILPVFLQATKRV